jgi:hypothetical protein
MTESEHARLAARLVPRRLARLRLEVLDRLLGDLTHMRLEGFRTLPPVVGVVIADLARAHDVSLPGIGDAPSPEITIAERHLLTARSQVMQELESLGAAATWADLELA